MRRRRHEGAARWRCPYSEPSIAAKTEFEIAPVAWLTGANDQDILDCTKLKTFQFLISRSRINLVHGNAARALGVYQLSHRFVGRPSNSPALQIGRASCRERVCQYV